jgi:RHS repeat-associated protein
VTCNNIDDDCNGQKDEDYEVVATTCGQGACAAAGETSCVNGVVQDSCTAGTSAASDADCDGIDQDCDGHADEAYVPIATSCGVGACLRSGTTACVDGSVQDACTPAAPATNDATCDGIDDDCDGVADDEFVPSATTCGSGACTGTGTTSCVAGHTSDSCVPACEGACADRLDDDFDGVTDCADPDCAQDGSCLVGAPCTSDDECALLGDEDHSAYCDMWSYPGGYCIRQCDPTIGDAACPAGTRCSEDFWFCVPNCDEDGACLRADHACQDANVFGSDEETCRPTCGQASCQLDLHCDAATNLCLECQASDTSCDGADNDCDGAIDEDFVPERSTCGEGGCGRTGTVSCVAGHFVDSCTPGTDCESGCTDGDDDDGDALVDCDDTDCSRQPECAHVGSPCVDDSQCEHAATQFSGAWCLTDVPGGYCVLGCDPFAVEDSCPAGSYCQSDSYLCMAACDASGDCSDEHQHCVAPPEYPESAERICSPTCAEGCRAGQRCVPDLSLCVDCASDDTTCDGQDDDCDGVVDDDVAPTPSTCGTGGCKRDGVVRCVDGQLSDTCTPGVECEIDCANGADEDGDTQVDCDDHDCSATPECATIGSPCARNSDCARLSGAEPALCSHDYPGGYCTLECEPGASAGGCPEGSSCSLSGMCLRDCDPQQGCAEPGFVCQAAPAYFQHEPFCHATCDAGCQPGMYCDAIANLCLECESEDSRCDGQDQDCDGAVDEDFVAVPATCGHGQCTAEGTATCAGGHVTLDCTPQPGCENDCDDGGDDDGDSLIDCADPECADSPECRIGSSCNSDEDCAVQGSTSQYDFFCWQGLFPGGYCVRQCDEADAQGLCPPGNECLHAEPICVRSCTQDGSCDNPDAVCEDLLAVLPDVPGAFCRPSCALGGCAPGERCDAISNVCSSCESSDASCDGVDQDCDGVADDDYVHESDGDPCTIDSCVAGARVHFAAPTGSACNFDGNPCLTGGTCEMKTSSTGAACLPVPAGAVAWWPGDGSADSLIGGLHGTLLNTTSFATGRGGTVFKLDGAANAIDLSAHATELNLAGAATLEMWIRGADNDCRTLFHLRQDDDNQQYLQIGDGCTSAATDELFTWTRIVNGVTSVRVYATTGSDRTRLTVGQYIHVAITFNGTNTVLYFNGQPRTMTQAVGADTGSWGAFANPTSATLGGSQPALVGAANFRTELDEITLYNRALGSSEILAIVNAAPVGQAVKCKSAPICEIATIQFGAICNDHDGCSDDDRCDATGVCHGTPVEVNDSNPCTDDQCSSTSDETSVVTHAVHSGEACTDGNLCTATDTCTAAGQCTGAAIDIDDHNVCTTDACDPSTGQITHLTLPPGSPCDDGNACTAGDACNADATCVSGVSQPDTDCNGFDDDCDGHVDEGYVAATTSCGISPCVGYGQLLCIGATQVNTCVSNCEGSCVDGIDDDNDGAIDCEDLDCFASRTDGNCNQADDDCDGNIDENWQAPQTTCGTGLCVSQGVLQCTPNGVVDTCQPAAPGIDSTCNRLDEDCDGLFDEGFVPQPTSCGTGVCTTAGTSSCVNGSIVESCEPGLPSAATDTTCNNLDEDCDGLVDEDFVKTCTGTARRFCSNGAVQTQQCSDGNLCNGQEICVLNGVCQSGTGPAVDDGNTCTTDSCDPVQGVRHQALAAGTLCGDEDACNGQETCALPTSCATVASGTNSWWPGDDNAYDVQAGHNGVPTNGLGFAAGHVGQAFAFDGTNDYLDLSAQVLGINVAGKGTLEMWLTPTSDICQVLFHFGVSESDSQYLSIGKCGLVPDQLVGWVRQGSIFSTVAYATTQRDELMFSGPHHLAVTFDGTNTLVYIDGTPRAATPVSGSDHGDIGGFFNPTFAQFGAYRKATGLQNFYGGVLDEPTLYSRALSASEIQAIYLAGANGKCRPSVCAPGTAPVVDDNNDCTIDHCTSATGVVHDNQALGAVCSDSNACTIGDLCDGSGTCIPGSLVDPTDGDPCTVDSCVATLGVQHEALPEGATCSAVDRCSDHMDSDGDGLVDCNDPDCAGRTPCLPESCTNGTDEDGDGKIDCPDQDCSGVPPCVETDCADGIDNEGDEYIDCNDRECSNSSSCPEICDNGTDDDADDQIDCADPECATNPICFEQICYDMADSDGDGLVDCADPDCIGRIGCVPEICGNSFDDDNDGLFDCADLDCDGLGPCQIVPPDPSSVAPVLDLTRATTMEDVSAFLYSGPDPIQRGVVPGTMVAERLSIIRGRVLTSDSTPLPGVRVLMLEHPEYGVTHTRADGRFDFAINAGDQSTLDVQLDGYLPAQRRVMANWHRPQELDDIVLLTVSQQVTSVVMTDAAGPQVAKGDVISDTDGRRQAVLLFPSATRAEVTLPDGSILPESEVSALSVRVTEYTVGPNGGKAMPADLPPNSEFTYAVELSADGAEHVEFNHKIPLYINNFIGMPIGTEMPLGYYNRIRGAWIASDNGVILKILSVDAGLASIDTDGDGLPDSASLLSRWGVTSEERAILASTFATGTELWRVEVDHFSTWDCNMAVYPPDNAAGPNGSTSSPPVSSGPPPICYQAGSIVECQSQVLGERIELAGTPMSLNYRSDRVPGGSSVVNVVLGSPDRLASMPFRSVTLEVRPKYGSVTRRTWSKQNVPSLATWNWNGRDAYGRGVQGENPVDISISYDYECVYQETKRFGYNGDGLQIEITPNPRRRVGEAEAAQSLANAGAAGASVTLPPCTFSFKQQLKATAAAFDFREVGIGGWSFSEHHVYDVEGQTLLLGDGRRVAAQELPAVVETVLPEESDPYAITAQHHLKAGPDGALYAVAGGAEGIGIARLVRGSFEPYYWDYNPGVGGLGSSCLGSSGAGQMLGGPGIIQDFTWGQGGELYAIVCNTSVVRVGSDGIPHLVAGTGTTDIAHDIADGTDALSTNLPQPSAIAAGPDGKIYVWVRDIDTGRSRLLLLDTDGRIHIMVGTATAAVGACDIAPEATNILAKDTYFCSPVASLATDGDGTLYLIDQVITGTLGGTFVYKLDASGRIERVAGRKQTSADPLEQTFLRQVPEDIDAKDVLISGGLMSISTDPSGLLHLFDSLGRDFVASPYGGFLYRSSGVFDYSHRDDRSMPEGAVARGAAIGATSFHGVSALSISPGQGNVSYQLSSLGAIAAIRAPTATQLNNEISVPSPEGKQIFVFSRSGRHLRTLHADTNTVLQTFAYDASGHLSSVTDAYGHVTSVERDSAGKLIAIVAPHGQRTVLVEDADGFLGEIKTQPSSPSYVLDYDNHAGLLSSLQDPRGNHHHFSYLQGKLVRDLSPDERDLSLARTESAASRTIMSTETDGGTTSYLLDWSRTGEIQSEVQFPDGTKSMTVQVADGTTTTTMPDGTVNSSVQTPDPTNGLLVPQMSRVTTLPSGLSRAVTMKANTTLSDPGNRYSWTSRKTETSVNGATWSETFDRPSRTLITTTPEGRESSVTYDSFGNLTRLQEAGRFPVLLAYDAEGRLWSTTQGSGVLARSVEYGFDSTSGYQSSTMNVELNENTQYARDFFGRPLQISRPDGQTTMLSYDEVGNLVQVFPPGRPGHITSFTAANLPEQYIAPSPTNGMAPSVEVREYTGHRRLRRLTRADGTEVTQSYGIDGKPNALHLPQGSMTYSYGPTGQLAIIDDVDGGKLLFSYDGKLLNGITWMPIQGHVHGTVTSTYDNNFQLSTVSVNGNVVVDYAYDNDGLVTAAGPMAVLHALSSGDVAGTNLGDTTTIESRNGFGEQDGYIAQYSGADLFSEQVTQRDSRGRIVEKIETIQGLGTVSRYRYDEAGRLSEVYADGQQTAHYTYDANGNRESYTKASVVEMGTYDAQDRLLTFGTHSYAYTSSGDLAAITEGINGDATSYEYDVLGNLRKVVLADGRIITYEIDGMNRRVGKSVNGVRVWGLLYQDRRRPVALLDAAGGVTATFVYATRENVPDVMIKNGAAYRMVVDHLGSVRLVVRVDDGSVAQRIDYDDFGVVLNDTNPGFQPFGFAGGIYDADTGLVRFGIRDYDATVGRWTRKDPMLFAGKDTNLFGYVGNDPINRSDPSGLQPDPTPYGGESRTIYSLCVQACIDAAQDVWNACVEPIDDALEACTSAGTGTLLGEACEALQKSGPPAYLTGASACIAGCVLGGANPFDAPCPPWFSSIECGEAGLGGY